MIRKSIKTLLKAKPTQIQTSGLKLNLFQLTFKNYFTTSQFSKFQQGKMSSTTIFKSESPSISLSVRSNSNKISQLTLNDFSQALKLSSRQFVAREPMSNLIWTQQEFEEALGSLIYQCCQSGLSFGVRDEQTNELIAAQLSVCLDNYQIEPNNSKSEPIFGILNKSEQVYLPENPSKTLALFIVVSNSKSSRKGNLKSILAHSEKIWKEKGFEQIFLDTTNISSSSLFKKCGYIQKNIVLYQQYEYKNEKPFLSLAEKHLGVTLMVKSLK